NAVQRCVERGRRIAERQDDADARNRVHASTGARWLQSAPPRWMSRHIQPRNATRSGVALVTRWRVGGGGGLGGVTVVVPALMLECLAEVANPAAERSADLRQLAGPEDQQRDDEDDDQLRCSYSEHASSRPRA